ncbi:MAG: hypothetical protein H6736_10815 [Alphaproteobacteria bacterium]|nr:hypothetical protein [Alphaproteobacteria bacterium]MCB9692294.1 hypothetical protein [Alphaproteobacteria bacterium]
MELPARDDAAEDAFVAGWIESDDTDGLVELVTLAIQERRPRLAGRLFQLLDDQLDPEPGSALDRAARAARMFLVRDELPEDRSWSALEEAWIDARRGRVRRIKQRWRDRLAGVDRRIGRLERKKR